MEFLDWLKTKKKLKNRSARDVLSRLRRIKKILGVDAIDDKTIEKLENNDSFQSLAHPIQVSLFRAVTLYLEFNNK